MIRIDQIWLATEPMDMRAGPDTVLARVVKVFGEAKPDCAYLFTNKRGHRLKILIHDGQGIWLCARRPEQTVQTLTVQCASYSTWALMRVRLTSIT